VKNLGRLDLIIIGSGLSSLTVAAILSLCKFKVLVLEQGDKAGGSLATFEEKGLELDQGGHITGGGVGSIGSPIRKFLDQVTGGLVTWCRMDDAYDVAVLAGSDKWETKEEVKFYSDVSRTKRELKEKFPEMKDQLAIDRYFFYVTLTKYALIPWAFCKLFPSAYWRKLTGKLLLAPAAICANQTTAAKIGKWTDNKALIGVLSYSHGGHGLNPSRASFIAQAAASAHFQKGAFYPRGGPSAIAMGACEVIRRNGGQVLTFAKVRRRHPPYYTIALLLTLNFSQVSRLLFDDDEDMGPHEFKKRTGRCWGVEVNGHSIFAQRIVSGIGIRGTYLNLVPPRYHDKVRSASERKQERAAAAPKRPHFFTRAEREGGASERAGGRAGGRASERASERTTSSYSLAREQPLPWLSLRSRANNLFLFARARITSSLALVRPPSNIILLCSLRSRARFASVLASLAPPSTNIRLLSWAPS
jgi:hypothetical protein